MIYIVKNEQQILRTIIEDSTLIDIIQDNYFVSSTAMNVFKTIQNLVLNKISLTETNLISNGSKIDSSITEEMIRNLFKVEFNVKEFKSYLKRLKSDKAGYEIQNNYVSSLVEEVSKKGELNVEKIRKIISNVSDTLDIINDKKDILRSSSQMVESYINVLIERKKGEHYYSTGDAYLDKILLKGFEPKWITTLFGATGIGKSIYGLNLVNKQINKRIPSLYISLEMDEISTMDRLIASRNKIPLKTLYPRFSEEHDIPDHVFEKVKNERNNLSKMKNFFFVEESNLSISDLKIIIKEAKKRMNTDYLICTIDLLTMITDFNIGVNKANQYETCMNNLHELAKSLNVHILGIVQANRETDNNKIKNIENLHYLKPALNNIKNSGAIAERSRIVLSTFRAKHYAEKLFPGSEELKIMKDIMEVDILKQNMGILGGIKYLYQGEYARLIKMRELEENE